MVNTALKVKSHTFANQFFSMNFLALEQGINPTTLPPLGCLKSIKMEVSRKVSRSFTQSLAKLKYMLSIICETLRFICEPLRERKNTF
jgi:hypothetical protein